MAQLSKNQLPQELKSSILGSFYWVIARLTTDKEVSIVFDDILTRTERIMIAKRIAALFLLSKGRSIREVCIALKMSTSTMGKFREKLDYDSSGLKLILQHLEKKQKNKEVQNKIEDFLRELGDFLPPQKHDMKRRWRSLK